MPMVIVTVIAMGLLCSVSIPHVLHKIAQGLCSIHPGMLLGYYAVRTLILQAAGQVGLDSDWLSFTHALILITDAMYEFQQTCPLQHEDLTQRLLSDLREPLLPLRHWYQKCV